ncbi:MULTISPECIES: ADP-heptose--LPS heptosyltransferase [Burkholderia]|uniref:ADP-heptose--LPS heptosyltransferase n=1 Tax=Burkholderia TaxID=32008 RepID=UPI000B06B5EC|nr:MULTISPECIES: ADP-heptose--LPS heptosyltransferase [unclassified Burkholderia]
MTKKNARAAPRSNGEPASSPDPAAHRAADGTPPPGNAALSPADALAYPGTLLSPDGKLVAPYDLECAPAAHPHGHAGAAARVGLLHAASRPFTLDYAAISAVHVVNGMGVALGDSVVGITALTAIRAAHAHLRVVLYRPAHTPGYVDALYRLAAGASVIAPPRALPWPAAALPSGARDARIDLGNHLYWPAFAATPMIDFFLSALGVPPESVPASAKRNRWLAGLALPELPPAWHGRRYVLFCARASTPLRSIPATQRAALVDRLARIYRLPVLGFEPIDHPDYVDVSSYCTDTGQFIGWVKHARAVFSVDTAAVHLADGFDVPTLALFSSIPPGLRARDYPHCTSVTLDLPDALRSRHASDRLDDLAQLEAAYRRIDWDALAWPRPRD